MIQLACGCVLHGSAVAYCKDHNERHPPPEFRPELSRGQQARPRRTYQPTEAGPLPELPRARRQRWDPQSGQLEEVENGD